MKYASHFYIFLQAGLPASDPLSNAVSQFHTGLQSRDILHGIQALHTLIGQMIVIACERALSLSLLNYLLTIACREAASGYDELLFRVLGKETSGKSTICFKTCINLP